jgi:DNA-binding winged helix-turn-helix (wHTH) protein/tetratricopeptide (TPR) repeat protein
MSLTRNDIYRFDEFELDPTSRIFSRDGTQIPLYPKAFEVLTYLVTNPGRVVTKEEIFKAVWPDSFVEESNLARQVSSLRRALGDRSACIVTVPGRGYQFAARVEEAPLADGFSRGQTEEVLVQRVRERTQVVIEESFPAPVQPSFDTEKKKLKNSPGFRSRTLVIAAAILAVAGTWVTGTHLWKKAHAGISPTQAETSAAEKSAVHRRSIAVLGFRNLTGRPEEAWLSTALAEMLSTELVAGEKLRLVSGEDIARTKLDLPLADADSLSRDTLLRLRKNLDSDLVVLGSYTVLGEKPATRIRLDLRLQDAAAGETVADVAVMGSEAELFDLVSQAGSQLREKLGVEEISPVDAVSVRASLPANREAARLYSEGLARLRVFDALGARSLLDQAIFADSKFALAHSAMAEAWSRLGYDKKAQQEAREAHHLSSNLSREGKLLVEGRYRDISHEYEQAIDVYRTLFTLFPDNVDYGLKLATAQVHGSRAHDALDTVKSLRKLAAPASEDPRIDMQESAAWDALSDYRQQEQALSRASEKAKNNGSRLILAQARQGQCWVFPHMELVESAIAACSEAANIFAAAGDREGEASSLRAWADAIARTDAPESIRLYQRALELFRMNGSERGIAGVYNNLGLIYESQGDLATAGKMYREALAGFQRMENKSFEATALGNIADVLVDQGDLHQAVQLYEKSLELDREDPGRAANAGYNIASVRQLQGDLAGARQGFEQSLAIWRKNGDQRSASYSMASLGDLLLLEADFTGARKMYEQALAIRNSAGDRITVSETQLDLANLSLEEGRSPAEQEAALRQVLDVFQKQKVRDDEIQAWCVLSHALLAQGKTAPAKEAMQHAQVLAAKSQNPAIRWRVEIDAARIEASQTAAARSAGGTLARKDMAAVIAKSQELGYSQAEFDARLALAELEIKAGQTAEGRAHLKAIEADARAKGYNLVARKAVIARG